MYYPIYVSLKKQLCVVIGGGKIAEGKVNGLLEAGANVTVISPDLTPRLREMTETKRIKYVARVYQCGDLTGAFMVICATNQADVNHQVWEEASANQQLVNVVDDTPHCNFIVPTILRNGDLTIAISTNGKAPALAVRLKERLQNQLGDEYARFLELAGELREPLTRRVPDMEARKKIWYQLVDSNVMELLAQGDEAAALDVIARITGV